MQIPRSQTTVLISIKVNLLLLSGTINKQIDYSQQSREIIMADSGEFSLARTIFTLTESSPGVLTHLASFEGSATDFNAPFGSLSYSQPLADGGASK